MKPLVLNNTDTIHNRDSMDCEKADIQLNSNKPVTQRQASRTDTLVVLGKIGKSHGLKGWQYFDCYCDNYKDIMEYSPLKLLSSNITNTQDIFTDSSTYKSARRIELITIQPHSKRYIVHIQGVDSPEQASTMAKRLVVTPRSQLPVPQKGQYYWHDLVGARVISIYQGREILLGTINSMQRIGSNDNMVIKSEEGKWHYVPFAQPDFVTDVQISPDMDPRVIVSWDPDF